MHLQKNSFWFCKSPYELGPQLVYFWTSENVRLLDLYEPGRGRWSENKQVVGPIPVDLFLEIQI
jgi:hypothetical protein